jgi:hypothetical protein
MFYYLLIRVFIDGIARVWAGFVSFKRNGNARFLYIRFFNLRVALKRRRELVSTWASVRYPGLFMLHRVSLQKDSIK